MRLRPFLAAAALSLSAPRLHAAITGYVVKVDSQAGAEKVYLDLGEGSGAAPGQAFAVFVEGDELKHPVTRESLGRVETKLAEGRIEEVAPKYSVGRLSLTGDRPGRIAEVQAGQKARVETGGAAPAASQDRPQAAQLPAAPQASGALHAPRWRSQPVPLEAVDMALGDVDGDGKAEILLADQTRVVAYADSEEGALKPLCSYDNKDTGFKLLSIDAADLDRGGRAKIFATYHNEFFNRVETLVLECKDGLFQKTAVLPWMTRAFQDADGGWKLAGKELIADRTFATNGNIRLLQASGGKYSLDGPQIKYKRLDWLYGFTLARTPGEEKPFPIFYSRNDRIRVQFQKSSWSTEDAFGQTSSRARWFDNSLRFTSRLAASRTAEGIDGLYALKNIARLGGLADSFGLYGNGELHRLRWTGLSLEEDWKAELGGYAADLAPVPAEGGRPAQLYVAVVGAAGKTSIWKFLQ